MSELKIQCSSTYIWKLSLVLRNVVKIQLRLFPKTRCCRVMGSLWVRIVCKCSVRVQFSGFFTLTRVWEFVIPQNNSFQPRFLQLGFAGLLGPGRRGFSCAPQDVQKRAGPFPVRSPHAQWWQLKMSPYAPLVSRGLWEGQNQSPLRTASSFFLKSGFRCMAKVSRSCRDFPCTLRSNLWLRQ